LERVMASYDPKIQSRLIRDLEPVVAKELDRHLAIQKIGTHMSLCHGVRDAPLLVH